MTSVPTFATRPTFLGVERTSADAAICVVGIPFNLGTSNRPGARFGPAAIRQASRMLVDGDHPASWAEIEALDLADIGDFRIAHGDIAGTLAKIEEQAAGIEHLVALGGDHTGTLPLLRRASARDRKSTRLNSSHVRISYAVFCLKKKKKSKVPTTSIVKA